MSDFIEELTVIQM